jgi:hypothetical protein
MDKPTNWFTNIGAIVASVGAVPTVFGEAHVGLPGWLYKICVICQVAAPIIIGKYAADASTVNKLTNGETK